jgi:MATE family multidrug resistance protein
MSVEIASFSLIVIFAGWLGVKSAAAYQITVNITGMIFLSAIGIGMAATVLVSNYKGAGNVQGIKEANRAIIGLVCSFTFVCTIILILCRYLFASFFVQEQDVIELAASLILILALFQIPDGLNVTVAGILRGLLDTKIPMIINSLAFWGVMIPVAYILAFVLN